MKAFLQSSAFGQLRVLQAVGHDSLSAIGRYLVEVLAPEDEPVDLQAALRAPALLVLDDVENDAIVRSIGVIVAAVAQLPAKQNLRYRFELAPDAFLFTKRFGYRVFQDQTVPEIVQTILTDGGFAADRLVQRLSGSYVARPYCVQYAESEWAFVERLLADEGISYWFDFLDDAPKLVLADDSHGHDTILEPTFVVFGDPASLGIARRIFELEASDRLVPTAVHVREYDVRQPSVPIDGRAGKDGYEYFEYPACVRDKKQADSRAKVRLEQLQRFSESSRANTNCIRLQPGRVFDLEGTSDDDLNVRHLVVSLDFRFESDEHSVDGVYRAQVTLTKLRESAFRPAVSLAAPRVESLEPAITTGPAGQEIHVNDLGDLKIRYLWDRSGKVDDTSSTWVRLLQTNMAGSMVLPRVGWEVAVSYVDGNPDRPVVLGRLYNGKNTVPYPLPAGKTTSTVQSATSPADGTTQEVRLGDAAGGMEFFVHATRDQSVFVGGSATRNVSANDTHDVTLALAVAAKTQSYTVSGAQTVNIGTDYITKVAGARTEMVGGMESTKLGGNRSLVVDGGYLELVGALYGLQCNQSNTDVTGIFTQGIGGSRLHVAALGTSESVAGARAEAVGGSRHIIASRSFGESVRGVKTITAGASSLRADAAVMTTSKAAGTTTVGGDANVEATGPIVISSAEITLDITGNITAESITIGGGTFKLTKGSSKLDGVVKRQGGTEIE